MSLVFVYFGWVQTGSPAETLTCGPKLDNDSLKKQSEVQSKSDPAFRPSPQRSVALITGFSAELIGVVFVLIKHKN